MDNASCETKQKDADNLKVVNNIINWGTCW